MQLLKEKIFEEENTVKLKELFYENFTNYKETNFSFSSLIDYKEFKKIIKNFISDIMCMLLSKTDYKNDKTNIFITELPKNIKGLFRDNDDDNRIIISEQVIKDIYDGNIEEMIAIFHELNHFKIKYEIKIGEINEDLSRIVKEKLIRSLNESPIKNLKSSYTNDNYYKDNYINYSGEVIANIYAKKDYVQFFHSLITYLKNENYHQEYIEELDNYFNEVVKEDILKYNNHLRDFRKSFYFNNYYLTFDEAFDLLIKHKPEWLIYPQISLEYFLGQDNIVRKKTKEELLKILEQTENNQIKEYIKYLIDNNEKVQESKVK